MRRLAINNTTGPRRGFTLIELLIVIVIIAAIMGMLLPAVMSAFTSARVAEVTTEIRGLEAAIAQFKAVYGVEPPSRIRLFTAAAGWTTPMMGNVVINGVTLTNEGERTRSVALINRIWPNFDFTIPRPYICTGSYVDLAGAECLVFFLGGRGTGSAGAYALTGFSKNPADPFAAATGSESREGPFFEFKASRLRASTNATAGVVNNSLVYFDPVSGQSAPYVYATGYDGRGYQIADLQVVPTASSNLTDVYRASIGGATAVAQKAKSFQIVSPGRDGLYGAGGYFNPTATNHGLANARDYDNITNFHSGLLNK